MARLKISSTLHLLIEIPNICKDYARRHRGCGMEENQSGVLDLVIIHK